MTLQNILNDIGSIIRKTKKSNKVITLSRFLFIFDGLYSGFETNLLFLIATNYKKRDYKPSNNNDI